MGINARFILLLPWWLGRSFNYRIDDFTVFKIITRMSLMNFVVIIAKDGFTCRAKPSQMTFEGLIPIILGLDGRSSWKSGGWRGLVWRVSIVKLEWGLRLRLMVVIWRGWQRMWGRRVRLSYSWCGSARALPRRRRCKDVWGSGIKVCSVRVINGINGLCFK